MALGSNSETAQFLISPEITGVSPSPSDPQHSENAVIEQETTKQHLDRLRSIIRNRRRPNNNFDIDNFGPLVTDAKSLDQLCIQRVAQGISTNVHSNSLDAVDYYTLNIPEKIVRVDTNVDGAPIRGGSAHGVMFLRLGLRNGDSLDAAVKAFPSPSRAFAEYVSTLEIRRRGIDTLEPIGVITEASKETTTLSKSNVSNGNAKEQSVGFYMSKIEPIRSMDRLRVLKSGYMALRDSPSPEAQHYLEYVADMGTILAQMHLRGIFPGDSQLKNFALKNDDTVIPIDLENVDIFNEDFYSSNPAKFAELSAKSLRVLYDSLVGQKPQNGQTKLGVNFFKGFSGIEVWEAFDQAVFSYYSRSVEESLLTSQESGDLDEVGFIEKLDILMPALDEIKAKIQDHILVSQTILVHQ